MPLVQTRGAASAQGFGEFAVVTVPNYIEEVFSCFLYTGTGTSLTQRIASGLDMSTKGGMVWIKNRTEVTDHEIYDTARGERKYIRSNTTDAEFDSGANSVQYKTSGWDAYAYVNEVNKVMASWTFRKQPKFFDVVTYTGTGAVQNIAHNLGSAPGCIIVKTLSVPGNDWGVYHRGLGATYKLNLNATTAAALSTGYWNNTTPTSTQFTVATSGITNQASETYVAYLFAHDSGGFGLTGTDNVISCGSYSGTGSVPNNITLGFEPQWLLVKNTTSSGQEWGMFDNMRGLVTGTDGDAQLFANASSAENVSAYFRATATGFACEDASTRYNASGNTYIYIAIRRGPMKVPTVGTSVFAQTSTTSATTPLTVTTNFPVDMAINRYSGAVSPTYVFSRLTGAASDGTRESVYLQTNSTAAETAPNAFGDSMVSNTALIDYAFLAGNSNAKIYWNFRRAPSFFDEVCYTGTGSTTTITHNLGVTPELVITKSRSQALGWVVWTTSLASTGYWIRLDTTDAVITSPVGYGGTFSASNYTIANTGPYNALNNSGSTYVAYLFATCAGVSKVGAYTGTGTTLQVDCGFTGGARFVLIKRTDSTGDWYVWDSARGIVAGNDPYLLLNTTAAEVTGTDYVDTYSAGFEISSTAPAGINASAGTYIFLAIA